MDNLLIHYPICIFQYGAMSSNIYSGMTKFVFLVFTIMVPILLLNMLIAMMANTYSTVISMSEKEWVKAVSHTGSYRIYFSFSRPELNLAI